MTSDYNYEAGLKDQDPRLLETDKAFRAIFSAENRRTPINQKDWMQTYTLVHDMCTKLDRHEEGVYCHYAMVVKEHAQERLEQLDKFRDDQLLREYNKIFGIFKTATASAAKICQTLSRFWIPQQQNAKKKVREIQPLSWVVWREVTYAPLKEKIWTAIYTNILAEREDRMIDKSLIRAFLENLSVLGVEGNQKYYEQEYESRYLSETAEYYNKEATAYITSNPIETYMTKAEARILREVSDCKVGFSCFNETVDKITKTMNSSWITNHMEALQGKFEGLIREDKEEDMRRFYFLLDRVPDGLLQSAKTLEKYVAELGKGHVAEMASKATAKESMEFSANLTKNLIALYRKYADLVKNKFSNHVLFREGLDKAMKEIMNTKSGKFFNLSRILNFYLDRLLTGVEKEESDKVIEMIDEVVDLFNYFRDKDEFGEYLKRTLCKRLLSVEKRFNETSERHLLSRLKEKQGQNYVYKIEGMFRDSQDDNTKRLRDSFAEWNGGPDVDGVAVNVQVLNEAHWPVSGGDKFVIPGRPAPMSKCMNKFEDFYSKDSVSNAKKLKWLWNEGLVTLEYKKGKTKLLLTMTPLQTAIITLFNPATGEKTAPKLSFSDIKDRLWPGSLSGGGDAGRAKLTGSAASALAGIDYNRLLTAAITPLVNPKRPHLLKQVKGTAGKVTPEDVYEVEVVSMNRKKLTFNQVTATEEKRRTDEDQTALVKSRGFEVDAAIVRTMKTRKVLKWQELQSEVIKQLQSRFAPTTQMLKKRVENLMEREYLERDPNDPTNYHYKA